jgi:hypothetical protein
VLVLKRQCLLAIRRVRAECGGADVLSRVLGVGGVLRNQGDTTVLRGLESNSLEIPVNWRT